MKLSKILLTSGLLAPAALAPMVLMTGCSTTWGHKSPLSIGSVEKNNVNNPYYQFQSKTYLDADGQNIPSYLQSNYTVDASSSTNYAYTTPISKWTKVENNKSWKLPVNEWEKGSSVWANANSDFTTQITDGNNITQICAQNIILKANVSFVATIGQFINKYTTYALSYAASQIPYSVGEISAEEQALRNENFKAAWGGVVPTTVESTVTAKGTSELLKEWLYTNTNSHATGQTEVYLKTTNSNFNFLNFPIPSYNADGSISAETKKLLTGNADSALDDTEPVIFYNGDPVVTNKDSENEYTTYTYKSVPVLVRATNLVQRYVNPKVSDSYFVDDYLQTDNNKIVDQLKEQWSKRPLAAKQPTVSKFELLTNGKDVSYEKKDARLASMDVKGSDYIALVTYSYVKWKNPDATKNRKDSVTLSSLQTILPAYLLEQAKDPTSLFTKCNDKKDNTGYMIDSSKADEVSTKLINLLTRNSNEGREPNASKLDDEYKCYLKLLWYMFGGSSQEFNFDFVEPTHM